MHGVLRKKGILHEKSALAESIGRLPRGMIRSYGHRPGIISGSQVSYCKRRRLHSSLGPGILEARTGVPKPLEIDPHRMDEDKKVVSSPVLYGLHHDYRMVSLTA